MNKNEIQILIDHYLEGTTTPEEEKTLARELRRDDIPDDWKVVRIMLGELAMTEAEYDVDVSEQLSRRKSVILPVYAKWLVAASVALLIGLFCFNHVARNKENVIAEVKINHAVEQKVVSNDTVSKESANNQQTKKTDKKVKISLDHKANNHNQLSENTPENTSKIQVKSVQDIPQPTPDNMELPNENLHYASTVAKDDQDDYQAPSRMEEFIVKLANYHHVKGDTLSCTSDKNDSTVICTAYVFEDTNETNLFRQLLLAACWYDDKTPGYLLNCSQQQFFFVLKDMHIGLKYLWIAERVKGKILLYTTRSPLDTEVSSEYFKEYRDKISNTSNYLKSKEL